jgi:uncharacterized protein YjbJ (UPF0337 family)
MNWEQVKGNWKQAKGQVKKQWGKLTDDELDVISGNRDILVGRIQEAYGITREESERQVRTWESNQTGYGTDDDRASDPMKRRKA